MLSLFSNSLLALILAPRYPWAFTSARLLAQRASCGIDPIACSSAQRASPSQGNNLHRGPVSVPVARTELLARSLSMSLVWMLMLKGPLVAAYSVPQGLGWPTKSAWRAFGHSLSGANGSSLWSSPTLAGCVYSHRPP